jgi:hypothetical protein
MMFSEVALGGAARCPSDGFGAARDSEITGPSAEPLGA